MSNILVKKEIRKENKFVMKILSAILVIAIMFNKFSFAIGIENFKEYRIYSKIGNEKYIYYDTRLQTNYEYYYLNENGVQMPAYCLELGVDGAETKDEYYVNVSEKLNNLVINNIILNGYPYKSLNELGVENISKAKYATQFAIWCYLSNLDINKIVATSTYNENVVTAIKNIYFNGINTKYYNENLIKLETTQIKVDNVDKSYLSTDISLEYNENVKSMNISVNGLSDYKITDELNNKIDDFNNIKKFKLLVPRDKIVEDTKVSLEINYDTNQTGILFGKAKIPNMQSLALVLKPITTKEVSKEFEIKYTPVKFRILKIDKYDESIKLQGVKFNIYDGENNLLGIFETDKNGEINLDLLKEFGIKNGENVKIEEIETLDNYYLNTENKVVNENNIKEIKIDYDTENKVIFENEKIKGKIEIIKTSKDYNEIYDINANSPLKDAIFQIYDDKNNLIQELKTNEFGKCISRDLFKGKYYIKEKIAPCGFELDVKVYEIEIKEHEKVVTLSLENKSKKKIELPKTGF